jgi:MoxR-like ATPase
MQRALHDAARGLVEREALLEVVVLAAVAEEHVLVVGPPGTAKSEAVRRVARAVSGHYFEYLFGRFTEPSEIFGPVDLRKLKEGVVETVTTGMLPEAEVAFLDEVFLGSTAILNTLLGLLNERTFRRGLTRVACPLRVCVGASNALPDDTALAAFADRFLLRVFVEPVPDPLLEKLLESGHTRDGTNTTAGLGALDVLVEASRLVDVTGVRATLAHAVRQLRSAGVTLSDRRIVKVQRLIAAAAALAARDVATHADLWPLVFAVPTRDAQVLARDALGPLLEGSESTALPAAALEASRGPLARAAVLVEAGDAVLARVPGDDTRARDAWRLELEGIARDIDASFDASKRPPAIVALREKITGALAR